ncbi:hypothetical protein LZ198_13015 [Myxococcus sp. K15C18031901]|uniref:LolA family protein n=1 Tax=Myxococcus dinghuensis TaxID=2906761 RepID=UPI0020A77B2E|nr:hypothetical protein [Myxococcus dinghuensis]MCP3099788.1 hypothetical protein [Myxococcus dinghuensis]
MIPSRYRHGLSGLVASAVLVATPALADWVGDLRVKSAPAPEQKGKAPETKGKMYGRADKLRMDLDVPQVPGGMSILFDWDKRTGTTLFHERKAATQRSLDELPVKIPGACTGKGQDYDTCFTSQGFKKVGSEKVNGHPTVVYEGVPPGAEDTIKRQRIWRPTDLPEVAYVRSLTYDLQNKLQAEIDVTNIQLGAQPDSRFTVPADYEELDAARPTAPPMMGTFKAEDLQGKSPEQIQELIRQRLNQQGAPATPPAPKKSTK